VSVRLAGDDEKGLRMGQNEDRPPDLRRAPLYTWKLTDILHGEGEPTLRNEYRLTFGRTAENSADVVQYCQELDGLQWDIERAMENLESLGERGHVLDEYPEQKLAAVCYEARNIGLRIYPYQEKTYRLVNSLLNLGVSENKAGRYNYDYKEEVLQRLNRPMFMKIETLLKNHFIRDDVVRSLLDARRLFVHRRARRDEALIMSRLMRERTRDPNEVDEFILSGDVERLRLDRLREALTVVDRLAELRWQLVAALSDLSLNT
jgi:hypothetical protein